MTIRRTAIFLLIFLVQSPCWAAENGDCELTDEYIAARNEAREEALQITSDYKHCKSASRQYAFWKAMARCTEENAGYNIGGGCAHIVSQGGYPVDKPDDLHCEHFRVSTEERARISNALLDKKGVQKCKT